MASELLSLSCVGFTLVDFTLVRFYVVVLRSSVTSLIPGLLRLRRCSLRCAQAFTIHLSTLIRFSLVVFSMVGFALTALVLAGCVLLGFPLVGFVLTAFALLDFALDLVPALFGNAMACSIRRQAWASDHEPSSAACSHL